jgi:hypothetical protein
MQDPSEQIVGQIFLSDTLENGAGYSSYFGAPVEAEQLMRFIVGQTNQTFYAPMVAQIDAHGNPAHAAAHLVQIASETSAILHITIF